MNEIDRNMAAYCSNDKRLNDLEKKVAEEIGRNELAHESYERRFSELKASSEKQTDILVAMQRQADAIEKVNEHMESTDKKIDKVVTSMDKVETRVAAIEKEPGEKWKKVTFELIKYGVLLAAGVLAGIAFKGFV